MTKLITSSGSVYHVKHVTAKVRDEAGNVASFGQVVNYMDILSLRVKELEAELERVTNDPLTAFADFRVEPARTWGTWN